MHQETEPLGESGMWATISHSGCSCWANYSENIMAQSNLNLNFLFLVFGFVQCQSFGTHCRKTCRLWRWDWENWYMYIGFGIDKGLHSTQKRSVTCQDKGKKTILIHRKRDCLYQQTVTMDLTLPVYFIDQGNLKVEFQSTCFQLQEIPLCWLNRMHNWT